MNFKLPKRKFIICYGYGFLISFIGGSWYFGFLFCDTILEILKFLAMMVPIAFLIDIVIGSIIYLIFSISQKK